MGLMGLKMMQLMLKTKRTITWGKTALAAIAQPKKAVVGLCKIACVFLLSTSLASAKNHSISYQHNPDIQLERFAFSIALVDAALERLKHRVKYDGSYRKIAFPWGDVPNNIGVCTDVVIRAYRRLGIDLQQNVHHDMLRHFYAYPNLPKWNLFRPDPNIDHRRVLNLQVFFARHGAALPISTNSNDYLPGDLVTWDIRPGVPHIGIVTHKVSQDKTRPLIVHNIAHGPQLEDVLFKMRITGHYRYQPGLQFNPALSQSPKNSPQQQAGL